jgi:Zn-dependent M16 (insulinase) family peptidase
MEPMFELLQDILKNPKWTEKDFIKSNIMQRMSSMQESLISDGHSYASSYASAPFRRLNALNETFGGITQFHFMNKLAEEEDLTEVIDKLQQLAKSIFTLSSIIVA